MKGRSPRVRETGSAVVTVRMSAALHSRLIAERDVRRKSLNQLILDCLYTQLPLGATGTTSKGIEDEQQSCDPPSDQ